MFPFMNQHRQTQKDRRPAAGIYRFRASGKLPGERRSVRDGPPLPCGHVRALRLRPRRAVSSRTQKELYLDHPSWPKAYSEKEK